MITYLLKRALPFIVTLAVGTGLGSIFGLHDPAPSNATTRVTSVDQFKVSSTSRGGGGGGGGVGFRLIIHFQPETRYTPEALEHKTTGVVTLLVQFNADGTTKVVDRLRSLPDGLTEDAERVALQTRFTPATEAEFDEPITVTQEMNYIYNLRERETIER